MPTWDYSVLPRMSMTYMVVQHGRLKFKDGNLNIWSHGYLLRLWLASFRSLDLNQSIFEVCEGSHLLSLPQGEISCKRGLGFPPLFNLITSGARDLQCVD
jgi:hypothetical protein